MLRNESKKNEFLKSELSKFVLISVLSLLIAVVFVAGNIQKERNKIFNNMQSKIKFEVEKELHKELSDKFRENIRDDLKKEYRDFVKIELRKSLRDDTFRTLKHHIDSEGIDLHYEIFETMEYKQDGESIYHCEVVVENLDKIFDEELEGLFRQIFGNKKDKKEILLVFSKQPEEAGYRPDFRIERGMNDQLLVVKDIKSVDYTESKLLF